jgi:multidrug resistance efflux pump
MKYTFLLLAAGLLLVLSACAAQPEAETPEVVEQPVIAPEGVVAEGKLKPVHAANLSFQARGTVEEINVKIGDAVSKGDVLARLTNFEIANAQRSAANLELSQAQQAYDQLVRTEGLDRASAWTSYMDAQVARAEAERRWEALNVDDIDTRIEDAKAALEDLETELTDAQDEFDKYKDLDEDNAKRVTAEDALETAQENYNEAVRDLDAISRERDTVRAGLDAALAAEAEAQYQFEQSVDGPNKDKLALLSARLENAKAQVAAAEESLNNYQVVAPFDGVVAEVAVEVGEQVGPEMRAVSVIDPSAWIVETTDVTELDIVKLEVGQAVTFVADALPDVTMNGVVTEISGASFVQGGDVLFTVRIQAEDVDPHVRWGMTVEVVFEPLE